MYIQSGERIGQGPLPYSLGAWATSPLDAATNGKLYWFNSKHGGSTTAVFVPDAAANTDPLNLLVWIHGDTICGDEGRNAISYVKGTTFPLARQVAASKQPLVLVAPSMQWKAGQNSHPLGAPQKMNAFLEEVRTGLGSAGWSATPSFGRLVLAGHSRGYAVLNGLAAAVNDPQWSQGALATLTSVWLFDTTYGKLHKQFHCKNWTRWAGAKKNVRLRIFYRRNSSTAPVAECIRDEAAAAGLANVTVKDFEPRALSHCAMPRELLPGLLGATSSPAPGAPPAIPQPANGSLLRQVQKALASGQWYVALGLAVLAGIRDENRLASMIFFARHPERAGRKITATEPNFKQLSREWLDIRDGLVRPFLEKRAVNPGGGAPG